MRNLFAFLVAINQYDQEEITDLAGCLNDLEAMQKNVEWFCKTNQDLTLHQRILTNQSATRQAVIDGFQLYEAATDGDICLFYFSGHGAQIDCPPEFWNEADQMLEAIVCHTEQGNDNLLIDKELSYLIAETQQSKDLHFLVIMDCCHSGSNTKGDSFCVRSVAPNLNSRDVDDYWGRASYEEIHLSDGTELQLTPPIGRHVKLAACSSSELAKEMRLGDDGQTRGVFSYVLLQVLKESGYNLSYRNLIHKARLKTELLATNQSPQLELTGLASSQGNLLFLNGALQEQQTAFKVSYEEVLRAGQAKRQWVLNVGHFYGIKVHDIAILSDGRTAEIEQVFATDSVLDPQCFTPVDESKILMAKVKPATRTILNLGFTTDSSAMLMKLMQDSCKPDKYPFVEFDNAKGVDYIVHAHHNEIYLTHPEEQTPIFERIRGHDENAVNCFLILVNQVAEWNHIVAINNPDPTIREDEIEIHLERVNSPHTFSNPDSAPPTPIQDWDGENVFRYIFDDVHPGGPWHTPAFRLSVTNRSKRRTFWVSALYCGGGYDNTANPPYPSTVFSIDNRFLPGKEITVVGTEHMVDEPNISNGEFVIPYRSIMLSILDDYFDQGYNEIQDVIKLFVSTAKIDTDPFNGKGIPIDVNDAQSPRMTRAGTARLAKYDWRAFEISITIVRPRDLGSIQVKQEKQIYGLSILGHPTFSARVIVSTCKEMLRSTALDSTGLTKHMAHPDIYFGNEHAALMTLSTGLGAIEGLSVIEFYRTDGTDFISQEQPLTIQLLPSIRAQCAFSEKIALMTYVAEERSYQCIAEMDNTGQLRILEWPTASPSLIEGLDNSVKLFLMRMQLDYLIS